jgi:hypothetical protein
MTRDEMIAEVDRRRLIEQVEAKRASAIEEPVAKAGPVTEPEFQPYQDERGNWIKAQPNTTDDIRGFGQTLLNAQSMGAGDEIVGSVRSKIDSMLPKTQADIIAQQFGGKEQSEDERIEMYRADADAAKKQFAQDNPVGSVATELAGGVANPLNKIKMASQGMGFLPKAMESIARGTIEGGVAGALENAEDRMAGAKTGAGWGAGIAAGLTGGLGGAGKFLSDERVTKQLAQWVDDGKGGTKKVFQPLNLADPESLLGKFYRNVVGVGYGGGKIGLQESDYLNNAPQFARFADPETGLVVPRTVGTKRGVDDAIDRIKTTGSQNADNIDDLKDRRIGGLEQTRDKINKDAGDVVEGNQARFDAAESRSKEAIPAIKPAANRAAVAEVVNEAIPEAMDAKTAAKIRGMSDQLEQEAEITSWWNNNAYKGIKEAEFKWDGGLRDEIEASLPDMDAYQRAELENIIDKIDRATDRASPNGLNIVNEGSSILDASGNPINPPSVSEIQTIDGDTLMEVRNFFARNANKVKSGKGKANRLVAGYFDDQMGKQLGTDSDAYKQLLDFNKRYNAKISLEKSAKAARNAARDMRTSDITRNARDKSDLQQQAIDKSRDADAATIQESSMLSNARAKKSAADKANKVSRDQGLAQTTKKIRDARDTAAIAKKRNTLNVNQDKGILNRGARGALAEDSSVGNKAVATGILGIPLGGLGLATIPAGVLTAKGLSTQTGQRALAGQLDIQKALSRALREGDMDTYTRLLSRYGSMKAAGE